MKLYLSYIKVAPCIYLKRLNAHLEPNVAQKCMRPVLCSELVPYNRCCSNRDALKRPQNTATLAFISQMSQ